MRCAPVGSGSSMSGERWAATPATRRAARRWPGHHGRSDVFHRVSVVGGLLSQVGEAPLLASALPGADRPIALWKVMLGTRPGRRSRSNIPCRRAAATCEPVRA